MRKRTRSTKNALIVAERAKSVAFANSERAKNAARLARAIIGEFGPDAQQFAASWIGFNALYKLASGDYERARFTNAIEEGLTDVQALHILETCVWDVSYLVHLPPGNMRHRHDVQHFREQSERDLATALDNELAPARRLVGLVSAVYQVRCNLFHGAKNPAAPRSRQLFKIGAKITKLVVDALATNAEQEPQDA